MAIRKSAPPTFLQRPGDTEVGLALRYEAARLKLSHALKVCERAGLKVVVDADAVALRLIPLEEYRDAVDLRELGAVVRVDNACRAPVAPPADFTPYARLTKGQQSAIDEVWDQDRPGRPEDFSWRYVRTGGYAQWEPAAEGLVDKPIK